MSFREVVGHLRHTPAGAHRHHRAGHPAWMVGGVVALAAVGAGTWFVTSTHSSWLNGHGRSTSGHVISASRKEATTTTTAPAPLTIASVAPANGATNVGFTGTIQINFSSPVAAESTLPTLSPAIPGTWKRSGDTLTFVPQAGFFEPYQTITVTIPSGMTDTGGGSLAAGQTVTFTVAANSVLRLQQLLAQLGYLPFNAGALSSEPTQADLVSPVPTSTAMSWAYPNVPSQLSSQWAAGQYNVITKGAVMAFESNNGLTVDGIAGPEVWSALEQAVAARKTDPRPYDYILVTEQSSNETLSVWQEGKIVYTTPCNTGVAGATTQLGTFPVETHYRWNVMKGTDVNGTPYDVTVPYAAYFYDGDAIHGYPRATYGWPQSNGCVELPINNAGYLFNSGLDWYGTLVTVYTP